MVRLLDYAQGLEAEWELQEGARKLVEVGMKQGRDVTAILHMVKDARMQALPIELSGTMEKLVSDARAVGLFVSIERTPKEGGAAISIRPKRAEEEKFGHEGMLLRIDPESGSLLGARPYPLDDDEETSSMKQVRRYLFDSCLELAKRPGNDLMRLGA